MVMEPERWPVAVGGVGGSGTRIIAELLTEMGVFMGDFVNHALDNYAWPLGAELDVPDIAPPPHRRQQSIAYALGGFEHAMLGALARSDRPYLGWGWKVPTSFLWLSELHDFFPGLRYLHVIRHGLDMAYSRNRSQVQLWGHRFDMSPGSRPSPEEVLRYWVRANRHAVAQGGALLRDRFLLINFDALCMNPEKGIGRMAGMLGLSLDRYHMAELVRRVHPPRSMNRYRRQPDLAALNLDDVREVERLGFPVDHQLFARAGAG